MEKYQTYPSTFLDARQRFNSELSDYYPQDALTNLFNIWHLDCWGMDKFELSQNRDQPYPYAKQLALAINRLKHGEPIQYITNKASFYGDIFYVTPDTLIPRNETEELVHWIIEDFKNHTFARQGIDLGSGSGCIAIELQKHLHPIQMTGVDLSEKALEVAKINSNNLGVPVRWEMGDMSDLDNFNGSWDIIVSNPPYIPSAQKSEMDRSVIEFEPSLALFEDRKQGLYFYDKIAAFSFKNLSPNGSVYVELNQYFYQDIEHVFLDYGFRDVVIKKDINDNQRMLKANIK